MYVCGQKNLLKTFHQLFERHKFPRFSIIVGDTGFGKKVLSDYISRELGCNLVPCSVDVASVRETILNAYTVTEPTLYMFMDCDEMSPAAKNSLLKVTEEPPNDAYFIMTVRDTSNVLGTIISRGTVFNVEPYTVDDLREYAKEKMCSFTDKEQSIVDEVCVCPQDVMTAKENNIQKVYDLADKFIQCIGASNLANELKITTLLNTKKDSTEGIDPVLFMRCVIFCCGTYIKNDCSLDDFKVFHQIIRYTVKYLAELNKKGSNKQCLLDNWIMALHLEITGGKLP